MPFLIVLGLAGFISAFSLRIVDPMVPLLVAGFNVDVAAIALLSSLFALPYALGQPFLGPLGDAKGKERIIFASLCIVTGALAISAFSPNYHVLMVCRIVTGLASGGIIPLSLAVIGDRFPLAERQIAISRYMVAVVTGQIVGAPTAGLVSDMYGWRAVFVLNAALVAIIAVMVLIWLRDRNRSPARALNFGAAKASYAEILSNPKAVICYSSVFVEGICIFGMFPFIAAHLQAEGVGGVREAGFVIGGLGLGGAIFAASASSLLKRFARRDIMGAGGLVLLAGFTADGFTHGWQSQMAAFTCIGFGFYMLHSALQTEATELSPTARGSSVALHAFFFFIGQAIGPFIFGWALPNMGLNMSTICAGLLICCVAIMARFLLNRADNRMLQAA